MNWLRRLAGFALVPLSLLPLAAIAPVVAPSVAKRIDVLQGVPPHTDAATAAQPTRNLLRLPPLVPPGHDRRHARAAAKHHLHIAGLRPYPTTREPR